MVCMVLVLRIMFGVLLKVCWDSERFLSDLDSVFMELSYRSVIPMRSVIVFGRRLRFRLLMLVVHVVCMVVMVHFELLWHKG
jgi:hypothetical protein